LKKIKETGLTDFLRKLRPKV